LDMGGNKLVITDGERYYEVLRDNIRPVEGAGENKIEEEG